MTVLWDLNRSLSLNPLTESRFVTGHEGHRSFCPRAPGAAPSLLDVNHGWHDPWDIELLVEC